MRPEEAIGSETVEAREARAPFRFPREMVVGLLALAVAWEIVSWFVPPFIVPGWGRIFKSLLGLPLDFVLVTLARVVGALVVSFVLGLGLAVAMYASTPVERYARPLVRLLMAVPAKRTGRPRSRRRSRVSGGSTFWSTTPASFLARASRRRASTNGIGSARLI